MNKRLLNRIDKVLTEIESTYKDCKITRGRYACTACKWNERIAKLLRDIKHA